ncbi:hypothetical protein Lal_00024454 [Lupinus albus]|nr:hypothetical protein Lal_00024454 [Lupinus albus]
MRKMMKQVIVQIKVTKRGKTKCLEAHARSLEDRIEIIFNEFGVPIGPDQRTVIQFSNFLGTITRSSDLCPLKVVPDKDLIWTYVKQKYIIPDVGKKFKYKTTHESVKNRPKDISESQFKELICYWSLRNTKILRLEEIAEETFKVTRNRSPTLTKTPSYLGEYWIGFLVTALVPPTPPPTLGSFPFPPYNTMLRGILAQARISQSQQSQNAISRPGEKTLAQARILQYSPGFHPPRGIQEVWGLLDVSRLSERVSPKRDVQTKDFSSLSEEFSLERESKNVNPKIELQTQKWVIFLGEKGGKGDFLGKNSYRGEKEAREEILNGSGFETLEI